MRIDIHLLGRIPIIRDRLQLPAIGSDGRPTTLTPRQALQIEESIQRANRASRIDPGAQNKQPTFFERLLSFASELFRYSS